MALRALSGVRFHSTHSVDSARSYCADLLKKHDYPSHVLGAFVHPQARDAHLAVRAFNVDVARIEDQVSSVAIGRLRMQFWRDAVERAFSDGARSTAAAATVVVAGQPAVAVLLRKVLRDDAAPLSRSFFQRVISSREQYLGGVPFATLDALETYAENTYSSLSYLALESFHRRSVTLDHIASHIGKASGIAAVLRGMPHLAHPSSSSSSPGTQTQQAAVVVFPLDVCAEFGVRQEDILRCAPAVGLADAVFKVATRANDHLITARKMLADAGDEARGAVFAVFLQAVPTALYLERLEAVDFDPFHRSLQRRAWKLPWRAYRAFSTKMF